MNFIGNSWKISVLLFHLQMRRKKYLRNFLSIHRLWHQTEVSRLPFTIFKALWKTSLTRRAFNCFKFHPTFHLSVRARKHLSYSEKCLPLNLETNLIRKFKWFPKIFSVCRLHYHLEGELHQNTRQINNSWEGTGEIIITDKVLESSNVNTHN